MTAAVATASPPRPRSSRQGIVEMLFAYAFTAPAFALLALTILAPLAVLAWLSFTNYELGAVDIGFVGLANFAKALGDPVFHRSMLNTLVYVAIAGRRRRPQRSVSRRESPRLMPAAPPAHRRDTSPPCGSRT